MENWKTGWRQTDGNGGQVDGRKPAADLLKDIAISSVPREVEPREPTVEYIPTPQAFILIDVDTIGPVLRWNRRHLLWMANPSPQPTTVNILAKLSPLIQSMFTPTGGSAKALTGHGFFIRNNIRVVVTRNYHYSRPETSNGLRRTGVVPQHRYIRSTFRFDPLRNTYWTVVRKHACKSLLTDAVSHQSSSTTFVMPCAFIQLFRPRGTNHLAPQSRSVSKVSQLAGRGLRNE